MAISMLSPVQRWHTCRFIKGAHLLILKEQDRLTCVAD